ncbi:MAG: GNAT family N-acetyltransferase [Firmicutes bacterium]|nr:GNAT family N-acetyltransferase [Bacillota bacterium]
MVTLKEVRPEDRELLYNINQKYLYEMTNFYDDPMDEAGNYHYGYFEEYFTDPKRKAFFILSDERLAGFAMVNPYSFTGRKTDHVMAEFTVFPVFRRKGVASKAAGLIFSSFPGRWEIKYNTKNTPAGALWTGLTAKYSPNTVVFSEFERVLVFTVK